MIKSTKNYDLFKFTPDNRNAICASHVSVLIDSIQNANLLSLRPILVNGNMEVIDGQHRLLAAKKLGLEIYYEIKTDLPADVILKINTSKNWVTADYLNYFCNHNYPEYLKLKEFIKKNNLTLKIGLNICLGKSHQSYAKFRSGELVFPEYLMERDIKPFWDTIECIKRFNGHSSYTASSRFWKALFIMFNIEHFSHVHWLTNLHKMTNKVSNKFNTKEYLGCFQNIYNHRATVKLNLIDEI